MKFFIDCLFYDQEEFIGTPLLSLYLLNNIIAPSNNCQITYPTIIIFLVLVNFGLSILFSSKQGETATKNAVIKVNINLQKPII